MTKRNRLLSLLLAAMLAFPAAPYTTVFVGNTAPTAVEAAEKKAAITNVATGALTLKKGETFQLKANRSDVTWKSSNQKIVTVSKSGKLKAIKKGTAVISVKAGKTKDSIQVTVGTKVTNVHVIKSAVALPVGGQSTIKADVSPANASNKNVIYQSANPKVASVSKDGVVTAKKTGSTKITVLASDGSKKKEIVTVTVRAANSAVRLQDDFYDAVNASTLEQHPLQEGQGTWSNFDGLQKMVQQNLSDMIDTLVAQKDSYAKDTIEQKITDFYLLARDMDTRDKAGVEPVKQYIDQIDQAQTVAEFVETLAQLQKIGVSSLINFSIGQDTLDSNKYVLTDAGPSYVLPKDYYAQGEANEAVQQAFKNLIQQMFVLAGESEQNAAQIAGQIYELQKEFALNGPGLDDRYDVNLTYNPYTKAELTSLYSNCDIESFLKTNGITNFEICIVREVENAKKVNNYLTLDHLEVLKNFTKFNLYMNYSGYLTSAHYKAAQQFNAALSGVLEEKSADTVAKELTQSLFSWEFGKLYADRYFSQESKKEIENMTKQLLETFRGRIQKIDWLSEATKQQAVKKLDTMNIKIGYPDQWPSYLEKISVDAQKGLVANIVQIVEALNANAQSKLDAGVDKSTWITTPQTVNAFYNPQANDITFPAAILQPPFYDKDAEYAQNLGAIGTVIGHEITHAFDNYGSGYDENGNYKNWWTQEDKDRFTAKAQEVIDYYSSIEITNGLFQNGESTVGENIADMGGMACVLDIIGDDKEAQRKAFESNANIWAANQSDPYRDYLLMVDVHSLNKVRVNAVLPLFDQFYDVYEVTNKDAMYVAPKDRVKIW